VSCPALEVDRVNKNFGALSVSRDVSLALPQGARHALIGPNGAGKTTLVNLISGLLRPSSGAVRIAGVDVTHHSPERRVGLGLARTFQISSLFPKLTVAENVGLALSAKLRLEAKFWGRLTARADLIGEAAELLERLGLLDLVSQRVADLAYGQRRLVEIALALAMSPKVMLLDEPAAGLSSAERCVLLDLLQRFPEDLTILVIEHDMGLVFEFARRITVLVEGGILMEGTVAEVRSDPRVRDVYLGSRPHA
jgi:branched-chain amino acid transport system ATP-binding protein